MNIGDRVIILTPRMLGLKATIVDIDNHTGWYLVTLDRYKDDVVLSKTRFGPYTEREIKLEGDEDD